MREAVPIFIILCCCCINAAFSFMKGSLCDIRHRKFSQFSEKSISSGDARLPRVTIEYCPGCKWMLRSAWLAQELLGTFEADIGEVALQPSNVQGTFIVSVNGVDVWERKRDGGFPEAKELKRRVRDIILLGKSLGHSDH